MPSCRSIALSLALALLASPASPAASDAVQAAPGALASPCPFCGGVFDPVGSLGEYGQLFGCTLAIELVTLS